MTGTHRADPFTRAGQDDTRAAWLRAALERAPRPLSAGARRRLGALLAPLGATRVSPPDNHPVNQGLPVDNGASKDRLQQGEEQVSPGRSGQA